MFSIAATNNVPLSMAIFVTYGFNFLLLALYTWLAYFVLCFTLGKFQSLEGEYLPPEKANLDAKILVKLLLQLFLCLIILQFQCHLFVVLALVSWSFIASIFAKILVFWSLLSFLLYLLKLFYPCLCSEQCCFNNRH